MKIVDVRILQRNIIRDRAEGVGEIRAGDIVELEIEGVCRLRNKVV